MADLTGTTPANTYKGLLQVNDYTDGVDATAKYIQDGEGTDSALAISTGNVGIGTTSPAAKLTVVQSGTIAGVDLTNACFLAGTSVTGIGIDDNEIIKKQGTGGGQLNIGSQGSAASIKFKTGANPTNGDIPYERMIIDSDGNVGIGTTSPTAPLHILESGTSDMLIIESTDSGALNSPDLTLYRNSATPLADDNLGVLKFRGKHSGGGTKDYANIQGIIVDPTNTTEDSKIAFEVRRAGSFEPRMEVGPDKVEVSSTTGGVIMPRMTTTQRNAIASPANGEMVYDTDLNKFYGYANNAWTALH